MRQNIAQAIVLALMSALLILLSGATGEPLRLSADRFEPATALSASTAQN